MPLLTEQILEEGSGYGSGFFPSLSSTYLFIHTVRKKKTGTRRPRVNMAAGQRRLISLAELQAFRMAGVEERNGEGCDLTAASGSASSGLFYRLR